MDRKRDLETVRRLRDGYESALDEAAHLREQYHRAVVKLHRSGMSLREIADGLGVSHQRVHQIVSPQGESPPARTKRGLAVGSIVMILLLVGVGTVAVLRSEPPKDSSNAYPTPSSSLTLSPPGHVRVERCLIRPLTIDSTFETVTIAADCQAQLAVLINARPVIVVLDPRTGEVFGAAGGLRASEQIRALLRG